MKVEVLEECNLPQGSVINNVTELKKHYKGIHCSMYGTYNVKVLKVNCSDLMQDDELTGWAKTFKETEDKITNPLNNPKLIAKQNRNIEQNSKREAVTPKEFIDQSNRLKNK